MNDSTSHNEKKSFIMRNYRYLNFPISIIIAVVLCLIFVDFNNNPIKNGIFPLAIILILIALLSIVVDEIIESSKKRFDKHLAAILQKREEIRKIRNSSNMDSSVSVKPILDQIVNEDDKIETANTVNEKEQKIETKKVELIKGYDEFKRSIISTRISVAFMGLIIGLIFIVLYIDFDQDKTLNVLLKMLIILASVAFISLVIDVLLEFILIHVFKRDQKMMEKPIKLKRPNFFTKNRRIYYVPIYLIAAFILMQVVIDFDRKTKIMSHVIIPENIILIVTFALIIFTDYILTKYHKKILPFDEAREQLINRLELEKKRLEVLYETDKSRDELSLRRKQAKQKKVELKKMKREELLKLKIELIQKRKESKIDLEIQKEEAKSSRAALLANKKAELEEARKKAASETREAELAEKKRALEEARKKAAMEIANHDEETRNNRALLLAKKKAELEAARNKIEENKEEIINQNRLLELRRKREELIRAREESRNEQNRAEELRKLKLELEKKRKEALQNRK